jgi:L-glutamine-phosphate cytidylyltransferase
LNVIILAAGKGERLRPLTQTQPKCLVKLFGKSLLDWQIETFQNIGINDITVITGYKSESIQLSNIKKITNNRFESTNMLETLFCGQNELKDQTIVSYGDIIFEERVLKKLVDSKHEISIITDEKWHDLWKLRFDNPLNDAESLKINEDSDIIDIGQPVSNISDIQGQFIGLMKFQNNGVTNLKKYYKKAKELSKNNINPLNSNVNFENSYMTDILNYLITEGCKLKAIKIQNGWLELDSFNDYELYHNLYERKNLKNLFSF